MTTHTQPHLPQSPASSASSAIACARRVTSAKRTRFLLAPTLMALGACNLAPAYHVPSASPVAATLPDHFKADPGWTEAIPADDVAKGAWWQLFNDPALDALEDKVEVTNQNVAGARAAWMQARAQITQARAALLPAAGVTASANRTGTFASSSQGGKSATSSFSVTASGDWEVDLWGKLANGLRQAHADADASAADLANATLSAQAALAENYLALRAVEAQAIVLDATVAADKRALTVVRNQYGVGVAARSDVDAAEQALASAISERTDLDRQRSADEDAIAVLIGENPSTFHLAPAATWRGQVPDVPATIPARLLQRRPDVASAERLVAAANAGIGIARAAWFPDVTLTGSVGSTASAISGLFGAASSFWSLGGQAAETLLDFGARAAKVKGARAAYDQAVANYRQTALTAFEQVEDNLAARDAYASEKHQATTASQAANRSAAIATNQRNAGTIDDTTLASAIVAAGGARSTLISDTLNQQLNAVALIAAVGGRWDDGVDTRGAAPNPDGSAPAH